MIQHQSSQSELAEVPDALARNNEIAPSCPYSTGVHEIGEADNGAKIVGVSAITDDRRPEPPLQNLWTIPIPTTPPHVSREESATGLALLDLSLAMNHVAQLTERLRFHDSKWLAREVDVEIDLSEISEGHKSTLGSRQTPDSGKSHDGPSHIWLPVARQSRRDASPVSVFDGDGRPLPRLTDLERTRVLSAGMIRLFRMLLEAAPDTRAKDTALYSLHNSRHRARWLIEMAIAQTVDERGSTAHQMLEQASGYAPRKRRSDESGGALEQGTDSYPIRLDAERALDSLFDSAHHPFYELLRMANEDDLLVVLLPTDSTRIHVEYRAPNIRPEYGAKRFNRWLRGWTPSSGMLTGEYSVQVPRGVHSHHLELLVDEEAYVKRFLVSSDIDRPLVDSLVQDLSALSEEMDSVRDRPGFHPRDKYAPKLLEGELQSIASRLVEITRRRSIDLERHYQYVSSTTGSSREGLAFNEQEEVQTRPEPDGILNRGFGLRDLQEFSGKYVADEYRQLAAKPISSPSLQNMAKRLKALGIEWDFRCDNDPRDFGGHVHARPRLVEGMRSTSDPLHVKAYFSVSDESPALMESVMRFICALLLLIAGMGALQAHSLTWLMAPFPRLESHPVVFTEPDAVVAVLLLVPGLLLTRLGLPRTGSVLAQIRTYQVRIAYLAMFAIAFLAIAVVAAPHDADVSVAMALTVMTLMVALLFSSFETITRRRARLKEIPASSVVPLWLREAAGVEDDAKEPDVRFVVTGAD